MVRSTEFPRSSKSHVRSCFFAKVVGAVLLFAPGCNTEFLPSTGDERYPSTLHSSVSPEESTTSTGGSVAPISEAGPSQPSLSISAKPVFCCNPLSIDFDAVHTDPADGRGVSRYAWDFGDGFKALGKTVKHTYVRAETYTIEVVATYVDGTSEQTETTRAVGVSEPLPPPDNSTTSDADSSADTVYADAGPDQSVNDGDVVILDGDGSRGSGTTALNYAWRQLSGPVVQLLTPNTVRATFVAQTGHADPYVMSFELNVQQAASSGADVVWVTVVPLGTVPPPIDATLPSKEQLTAWLAELPPLPKVHYSFPILETMLVEPADPLLSQYVRVSRAVSVAGEGVTELQLKAAVSLCQQADRDDLGAPASIAVNYSPWHRLFPPDLPPTYDGPESAAEIQMFRDRLTYIRRTLASINTTRGTQVAVTAILFDTERFYVKPTSDPTAATWNAAIDEKYAAIYNIARELYPDARIEWYGRGIEESDAATGWSPFPWFTFREPGDTFSCSLYRVPEIGTMREAFRRTYDFADEHGVTSVTPWVALGAGYRRQPDQFQAWYTDWDYDTVYSMLLGREINTPWYGQQPDRYAPWGAASVVIFYPPPFDERTPAWGKHFVAYARGAAEIDELP